MREIHGVTVVPKATWKVGDRMEPAVEPSTSTVHDESAADPMEAYLRGVGHKLPSDVRKRKRASHGHEDETDPSNDPVLLKAEIQRLKGRESQLLEEMRVTEAQASFDREEMEKKRRI